MGYHSVIPLSEAIQVDKVQHTGTSEALMLLRSNKVDFRETKFY